MKPFVQSKILAAGLLLTAHLLFLSSAAQTTADDFVEIPELVFRNPVLITPARTAGKEGAIYRFPNVAPGYDAKILLKDFSRSDIVVQSIDISNQGFDKAFQPQFGLPGNVAKKTEWHIDFQMTFVQAGTNTPVALDKFSATVLDLDGDGQSVAEYIKMENATSVALAPVSSLAKPVNALLPSACGKCGKSSLATACLDCLGTGIDPKSGKGGSSLKQCGKCAGVGQVYLACSHPWEGATATINGTSDNFASIDTAATSVMSAFTFNNRDVINFTLGATTGNTSSTAGIRMNSIWFKGFSMLMPASYTVLPVKLAAFTAAGRNSQVNLDWTIAGEDPFSAFVVERSTDGVVYRDAGSVKACCHAKGCYRYQDAGISTGTVYYRLRMVGKNGETQYSATRMVKNEWPATARLATYPNPVVNQLNVRLPLAWQDKQVTLEVYNSHGTRVQAQAVSGAYGAATLEMRHLPKGFYIVKAMAGTETTQQSVLK